MLSRIFKKDFTVIRRNPGQYIQDINSDDLGMWQDSGQISFTINANVQPAPNEITEILPEGYRDKSSYLVITESELFGVEENIKNPDIILIYGKEHVILKKKIYNSTYLSHYELVAVQKESDQ